MIYNELGKTGKKVSAIGLGCEHLDGKPYEQVKEVIDAAIENGINLFDVFMPGREVRENIAKALGSRRDQVMIQGHIGSTDIHEQYDVSRDLPSVKKYFEEMLGIFGYIDFGMMFFIDTEKDYKDVFETDFVDYVLRLKEQGDIRHIGFSSHNPITAAKVISTGVPDMMMFSINPAFDMLPSEEYIFDHIETDMGVKLYRGLDPKRAEPVSYTHLTYEPIYLEEAEFFARQMTELFEDKENGGYFLTASDAETLITRPKETYDGAIPSGNSSAAVLLSQLAQYSCDSFWQEALERQIHFLTGAAKGYPSGHSFGMQALLRALYPSQELICTTSGDRVPETLKEHLLKEPAFNRSVIVKTRNNQAELEKIIPYVKEYPIPEEGAMYYLCQNGRCRAPVRDLVGKL